MGMIGDTLAAQIDKLPNMASLEKYAEDIQDIGVDTSSVKSVKQLIDNGTDPLHAVYLAIQNLTSLFAECVSALPELKAYYDIVDYAEEEYMPNGPPWSPLTRSYFTCWAFYDLQFGPDKETIGTCIMDMADHLDFSTDMREALETMQNSRMGIYEHCGIRSSRVLLKEFISQEEYSCYVPAGYSGEKGQNWLVRILPPIHDSFDYNVAFNTPYILVNETKEDWMAFIKRTLLGAGKTNDMQSFHEFMKYGLETHYWNEYIFKAYHHNQYDAIFLAGLPDVKGSLPHGDLPKIDSVMPKRKVLKLRKKRRKE
jgi:hypothetical protein